MGRAWNEWVSTVQHQHGQLAENAGEAPRDLRGEAARAAMWQGHGGYEIAFVPVVAGLAGWAIDGALGLTPILTIVFVVAGLFGAIANQYYRYVGSMKTYAEERERSHVEAQVGIVVVPFAPVEQVELPGYVLAADVDDKQSSEQVNR